MSISNTPTYNLKVVIKETGISADTLRAWERRYGLPSPERSPGGHRLYSERDIEIVRWLRAKQREGLSISRAVDLWNELSASGNEPLPASVTQIAPTPNANLDSIRKQWLDACLTFNENLADQVLNQAFALHPLETVCIEVLQKGLVEMGDMWYHSKATVQQEHFTSALAHRRLDALISATPPPNRSETILIGCPAQEQHTFTPLLITLLMRRRGFKVIYLGANVPNQRFRDTLLTVKPNLVILAVQILQNVNELRETVEHLSASGARVAYGGRIFNLLPELRTRIPAHFLGETIREAIQASETLIHTDVPIGNISPISEKDKLLVDAYIRSQPTISMYALAETNKIGIPMQYSSAAIQQLSNNLKSTLSLGNIETLRLEIEWIKGLLREHIQDPSELGKFIESYAIAIDTAMADEGKPISDWLRKQVN